MAKKKTPQVDPGSWGDFDLRPTEPGSAPPELSQMLTPNPTDPDFIQGAKDFARGLERDAGRPLQWLLGWDVAQRQKEILG